MEPYPSQRTRFTERGLALSPGPADAGASAAGAITPRQEIDLFSGEMHYWRVTRTHWRRALEGLRSLGLSVVATQVPWNVHEIRAGHFDWEGALDLGAFLDLAAELGLLVVLRPGPGADAESNHLGFPRRVLENAACQALTARDTPAWLPLPPRMFPVPSYASRPFQREVETWLAAVAEVVAPRLWPAGPVVALEVDGGGQLFARAGAYDLDYHQDALTWWREYAGHDEAPRAFAPDDAERCVRWVHFKRAYTARSLAWMERALDRAGLVGVARFHSAALADLGSIDLVRASDAGGLATTGFRYPCRGTQREGERGRALLLAGSASPLPFAPEVGLGGPPWLPPRTPEDAQGTLLTLLAAGVRAFNLYMTVDRDRWYGAPVAHTGALRPHGAWLGRLLQALSEVRWTTLERPAPVALLVSHTDAAFAAATSTVDPIAPFLLEFAGPGPGGAAELSRDADAPLYRRWLDACQRALGLAQIPYLLVDEHVAAERLTGHRVVIAPTLNRVGSGLWRTLHRLATRGVVVIIGPERPTLDQHGTPLEDPSLPARAGLIQRQSLDDINGLADDLAAVAGHLSDEWSAESDAVDCSLFVDPAGRARVCFVRNDQPNARSVTIVVPPGVTLRDPIAGEHARADRDGRLEIALPGYGTRMMLVE